MTENEQIQIKFRIGRTFTPSAPIDDATLFAGRRSQITKLVNAVTQRGQHAVLFGERGVGKTSLANVIKSFIGNSGSPFIVVSTNCETQTTFQSIWTNILNDIAFTQTKIGVGFNPPQHTEVSHIGAMLSTDASPEEIRSILQRLGVPSIIVIDEIDRVRDPATKTRLADTIKTLSDHVVDATLVLVGVADSLDQLISEHRSIERALVQIQMPRMSKGELEEIINKGLTALGMAIEGNAKNRIAALSHRLPHYTHTMALHAAQAADEQSAMTIGEAH
ncbi:MAG: hypothetical protein JWM16_3405, partial [Verrucomicrobiales bacterium]|nr:hypothetical protein [Verrucomicrobiales bacterium]